MEIGRINQLFTENLITAEEHEFLISKVVEQKKRFSLKALAALIIPVFGYILLLTFTVNGHAMGLVRDGETRLWIGMITGLIGFLFYFASKSDIKSGNYKGVEIANFGFGIASAILIIVLPVLIMM